MLKNENLPPLKQWNSPSGVNLPLFKNRCFILYIINFLKKLQLQLDGTADQSIDEYFALLVIDAFDAYERCNAGKTDSKIIENNVVVLMGRFVTDLCESLTDADDFLDGL